MIKNSYLDYWFLEETSFVRNQKVLREKMAKAKRISEREIARSRKGFGAIMVIDGSKDDLMSESVNWMKVDSGGL